MSSLQGLQVPIRVRSIGGSGDRQGPHHERLIREERHREAVVTDLLDLLDLPDQGAGGR